MKPYVLVALVTALGAGGAAAQPIKIAHLYDRGGALADDGRQLQVGLEMGVEYATGGTNHVLGRPIVIIEKDSERRPQRARAALAEAYGEDAVVLAVGPPGADAALGALAVAAEHRKILIAESGADAITGAAWNRYVFRVASSWSQRAIANAIVAARPGACIATIAPDHPFGRAGIAAYRAAANKLGALVLREEYVGPGEADPTAPVRRLLDAVTGSPSCREKHVFGLGAGGDHPFRQLLRLPPSKYAGITLTIGDAALPEDVYRRFPGLEGAAGYHYLSPANSANDWLVVQHFMRFNRPPSPLVAQGMAEAMFIVTAIRKAESTDTEALIEAMEGLSFETPKGRLTMRPEDHQALQPMYHFRMSSTHGQLPVREIKAREIELPIRNRP